MQFSDRPNFENRQCRTNKVKKRHLVKLHYNASIDESSEVGTSGLEVENTRKTGEPIEIIVGIGQTGWDQALIRKFSSAKITADQFHFMITLTISVFLSKKS